MSRVSGVVMLLVLVVAANIAGQLGKTLELAVLVAGVLVVVVVLEEVFRHVRTWRSELQWKDEERQHMRRRLDELELQYQKEHPAPAPPAGG